MSGMGAAYLALLVDAAAVALITALGVGLFLWSRRGRRRAAGKRR